MTQDQEREADPKNPGWCIGCTPDECIGCGNGLTRTAPAAVPAEHLPTAEHIRELAQEALDQIMEQAQVFASVWSMVDGRFDSGNALADAEHAKSELRTMVRSLADLAAETVRQAEQIKELRAALSEAIEPVAAWPQHRGQLLGKMRLALSNTKDQ